MNKVKTWFCYDGLSLKRHINMLVYAQPTYLHLKALQLARSLTGGVGGKDGKGKCEGTVHLCRLVRRGVGIGCIGRLRLRWAHLMREITLRGKMGGIMGDEEGGMKIHEEGGIKGDEFGWNHR